MVDPAAKCTQNIEFHNIIGQSATVMLQAFSVFRFSPRSRHRLLLFGMLLYALVLYDSKYLEKSYESLSPKRI